MKGTNEVRCGMTGTVLFLCDDNAVLSPMAEAFLRRHCRAYFKVYSAGIEPAAFHLLMLQVMEEVGYEIYNAHATGIFEFNHLQHVDYLITLTDEVNARLTFNQSNIGSHLHWPFKNPLIQPGQSACSLINKQAEIQDENFDSLFPIHSPFLDSIMIKTRLRVGLQAPVRCVKPENLAEVKERFRKTRDEIEVQIMNWLEEQGIGPLWWRG